MAFGAVVAGLGTGASVVVAADVGAAVLDAADVGAAVVDPTDEDDGPAASVRPLQALSPPPTAMDVDQARKFRRDMVMIRPPQIRG
jgi:hypothetical protein